MRVLFPVAGRGFLQVGIGIVLPPPPQHGVGLHEAEQVLGHGQLAHPRVGGPLAVGRQLVERRPHGALAVGPEVHVVVEHESNGTGAALGPTRGRPTAVGRS